MIGDHTHSEDCPLCRGTGKATHQDLLKRLNIAYADGKREMNDDVVNVVEGLNLDGPPTMDEMVLSPQQFVLGRLGRCVEAIRKLKEGI